jgi:hypothetical protein
MDYLAGEPSAPVHSLSDILAQGLYHSALEPRWRRIDTVSARSSDAHRAALAKQRVLRQRLVQVLDSLRLDALLYPTVQRKPAMIGEPQAGSTCQLSANSGLPALTAPAGFTADGLPVGLELLGRPFADPRLVQLAYGFEQAGPRRRPPGTTPPLVDGHAPSPRAFSVTAAGASASGPRAEARLVLDASRLELRYDVRALGVSADQVMAIALQRTDSAGVGPVVYRLSGPGTSSASGTLALDAGDLPALETGRYQLTLFTTDQPAGAARGRLTTPR